MTPDERVLLLTRQALGIADFARRLQAVTCAIRGDEAFLETGDLLIGLQPDPRSGGCLEKDPRRV